MEKKDVTFALSAMKSSVILPVEGMTGVVGWLVYVCCGCFLLLSIGWMSYKAYGLWAGVLAWRRAGLRGRQRYVLGCWGMILSIGATAILALLIWAFIDVIVFEPPEIVRFEESRFVLVYRWPVFNRTVPYRSIKSVNLKDPYAHLQPRYHARPLQAAVVITTDDYSYQIQPSRKRARAIYEELLRHQDQFAAEGAR